MFSALKGEIDAKSEQLIKENIFIKEISKLSDFIITK